MLQRTIVVKATGFTAFGQWVIPTTWSNEKERLIAYKHYHNYLENITKHNQLTLITELTQNNVIGIATGELIPEEMTQRELIGQATRVVESESDERV